jgi:hypothetical protein
METAKLAGLALALGAIFYLLMPPAPARAQSAEDECAKAAAAVPYAQRRAAYDKCMAAKLKAKDKKG